MVEKVIELYASSFLSFSALEIEKHYDFPAIFYSELGEVISFNKEQFVDNTKNLSGKYKSIGLGKIEFEVKNTQKVSNALELASIL